MRHAEQPVIQGSGNTCMVQLDDTTVYATSFDTCVCLQLQINGNLIYTEEFVSCNCCKHVSLWAKAVLCYHLVGDEQYTMIGSDFWGIQKNQGKGRVISWSLRLRLITFTETLIILDITKTESNSFFVIHWQKKKWSHVFAVSLRASNTKRTNLTWLP